MNFLVCLSTITFIKLSVTGDIVGSQSERTMHGGRMDGGGRQGEGVKKVKITGCDKEHEDHEMLVEHFQVRMILFFVGPTLF